MPHEATDTETENSKIHYPYVCNNQIELHLEDGRATATLRCTVEIHNPDQKKAHVIHQVWERRGRINIYYRW
jgi:hypothetical protein